MVRGERLHRGDRLADGWTPIAYPPEGDPLLAYPPPPDTLKAPVSGGLKAPVSGPKERKEVQSITTFLKKAPDGEDVRTPENQPPPPIPQDLSYPPVPSFSHVPYGKQTRLYAKLYRKLATPNWPPLTDDLLDVFESHRYQTKKTILDGLLDQEQRLRGPGPLQAPGSHSEASSIVKHARSRLDRNTHASG